MSGKRVLKIEVLGDSKDAQKSFDDLGISAGDVVGKVGEIGGALAGAVLTGALEDSTVSLGTLQAQLGLTKEETQELGSVARDVYTNNFGASIGEATRVTGLLHQALGSTGVELQEATEDVFRITDAFGELGAEPDIIAENVRVMKKAFPDKTDAEILDLIAFGFQEGAGRSGDLADSLQEYPRFFSEIGLSGEDMMNFINTGMDAGARNSDLLGDAVKEMGIIIQEVGSDGQERLGKIFGDDEAEVLIENFAAGGEAGREAFFTILEGLNEIEDPLERNAAATDLFGTKGEDLAGVLEDMLPAFLATKDATTEIGDVTGSLDAQYVGMGSTLEGFKRKFENSLIGPLGSVGAPAQEAITAFGGVATGLAGLSAMGIDVAGNLTTLGSKLLSAVSPTNLVTAAQWLYNAALTANPIGLVVVALGLLVGGLILAYTQSETFREIVNGAWESIHETVLPILAWFTDTLVPFFTDTIPETFRTFREMSVGEIVALAGEMLTKAPEVIENIITGMANLLAEGAGGAFGLWVSFNTRIGELLVTLGSWLLTDAGPMIVSKLVEGLRNLITEDNIMGAVGQFNKMVDMVNTKILALGTWLLTEGGPAIVSKLVEGLKALFTVDNAEGVIGVFVKMRNAIDTKVVEIATESLSWAAGIATNFIQGLIDNMTSFEALQKIYDAAKGLGQSMLDGAKDILKVWSPSREARLIGQYFYQGLILGMEDGMHEVYRWGWNLGTAAADGSRDAWDGYGASWWNGEYIVPEPQMPHNNFYDWGWNLGTSAAEGAIDGYDAAGGPGSPGFAPGGAPGASGSPGMGGEIDSGPTDSAQESSGGGGGSPVGVLAGGLQLPSGLSLASGQRYALSQVTGRLGLEFVYQYILAGLAEHNPITNIIAELQALAGSPLSGTVGLGASGGGGFGGGSGPMSLTVNLGNDTLISSVLDFPLPGMSLTQEV